MPERRPPARPTAKGQNIAKPPVLFGQTQKVIARIEQKLGSAFLAYWNSPNGSVCQNDVVGLYGVLRTLGAKPQISLFIKSYGGSGEAALRMVNLSMCPDRSSSMLLIFTRSFLKGRNPRWRAM